MISQRSVGILRLEEVNLVAATDGPLDDLGRGKRLAVHQEHRTGHAQAHLYGNGILRPCCSAGQ